MTHCIDFFRKFKKEGNFCGLDKSEVSRLNAYLEIVELLMKQKIPEETVYENFPVSAARPLISARDKARETGLNYVTTALKKGERVKTGALQSKLEKFAHANPRPKKSWRSPTVPTEPKPENDQKPEHFFAPLNDGKPVPDPATLAESMRGNDKPAAEPENIVPQKEIDTAPPCKDGKPCPTPDGRSYLVIQEQLGNKCSACGTYLTNLTYCPILQRQKAAEQNASMFTTGGKIKALDERAPAELPRVAQNQPMELRIRFNAKQWKTLKQIVSEDLAEDLTGAVLYLVDEAGERMGGR